MNEEKTIYPYQIRDLEDLEGEIWRDIAGYEGYYQVSNLGRIKSLARTRRVNKNGGIQQVKEKILKQSIGDGYLQVCLSKDNVHDPKPVHRWVARAFLEDYSEDLEVNHIDEDKYNNCVGNLNMMTRKQNINYGTRNERSAKTQTNNPQRSKQVGQFTLDGTLITVYPSTKECGRQGFTQTTVAACCRGIHKQHKGFIWKYI